ncbi:STAS domain-containing protein [Micromonospora tarensis]|uniref:STAS domain-containing protein n=1 Tax=Micromonospora tarensis TaxID=2806100 RepID=A0ABS1YD21_9ACTN|nr:STAS domain-containing protein [Micromonospora tarensis]MBM0275289.1 STAS domain-containing protein [Micromonospora tarensis]
MSLTLSRDGSFSLIRVAGEIDSNAHLLTELVEFLCRAPRPMVAVDLSAVHFFGAHGVSALLRAGQLAARADGRLTLRHPSPFVRRVLAVTGVTRHLALDRPSEPTGAHLGDTVSPSPRRPASPAPKERHVQSTGSQGHCARKPDPQLA